MRGDIRTRRPASTDGNFTCDGAPIPIGGDQADFGRWRLVKALGSIVGQTTKRPERTLCLALFKGESRSGKPQPARYISFKNGTI